MSDVIKSSPADSTEPYLKQTTDVDPIETQEWLDSLEYIISSKGHDRAKYHPVAHRYVGGGSVRQPGKPFGATVP